MICNYCNKVFSNKGGLGAHIKMCKRIHEISDNVVADYVTNGIRMICKKYNVGHSTVTYILQNSGIHIRTKKESVALSNKLFPDCHKHTTESKEKIRVKRLEWMKANPEKTAWRTRNKPSYPETLFMKICDDLNLSSKYDIVREYSVFPFFIDFAFINAKVAIEIDGSQHWLDKDRIERDIRKNSKLLDEGWRVMHIPEFKLRESYQEISNEICAFLLDCSITEKLYASDIIEYEHLKVNRKKLKYKQQSEYQRRKRLNIRLSVCSDPYIKEKILSDYVDRTNCISTEYKLNIKDSRKIDFQSVYPTFGWSTKLGNKWNMSSQAASRYCHKYFNIGTEHVRITKENILDCFSKNMNLTQIGNLYSLDSSTVSDYCKKYNIEIPKYVVKVDWKTIDLHELLKTKTGAQIAKELDVTPSSVYNQIKKLGHIV